MNYFIYNPKSEKILDQFQKRNIFLFRPDRIPINIQLRKIILIESENCMMNQMFVEIASFYDWLKENEGNKAFFTREILQKDGCKNIQNQSLFLYFLFNIEITITEKYQFQYYFPTNAQFYFSDRERSIKPFFFEDIEQIFKQPFKKINVSQLSKLTYYFNDVLQKDEIDFSQYYITSKPIIMRKQITKVQYSTKLLLQQNGDIILSSFNSSNNISLSFSKIFHNQKSFFLQHKYLNCIFRPVSIGLLDTNYNHASRAQVFDSNVLIYDGYMLNGYFHGEGTFYDTRGQILYQGSLLANQRQGIGTILNKFGYLYGPFLNDMMNGEFKPQQGDGPIHYYKKDIEVTKESHCLQQSIVLLDQNNKQQVLNTNGVQTQLQMCTYKDYYVHIQGYINMQPGKWLFETIVDYFVAYFYNQVSLQKGKRRTIFYNTDQTQTFLNADQPLIQYQQKDRRVFVMNYCRSHFIILISDEEFLYCCDSLYTQKPELEVQFCKLLGLKKSSAIKLNCTQQQNGYDCGIFAIFYTLQFLRYDDLNIREIEKKLKISNISEVRWQLGQMIKNNHNYILTNF